MFSSMCQVAKVEESKIVENLKPRKDVEWKPMVDMFYAEDLKPKDVELKPTNDVNGEVLNLPKDTELKPKDNFVNTKESIPVTDVELKPMEDILDTKELKEKDFKALKDVEVKTLNTVEDLKFSKDVEEMKSKVDELESKLGQVSLILTI